MCPTTRRHDSSLIIHSHISALQLFTIPLDCTGTRNIDLPDWMIERIATKAGKRCFIFTCAFR